jgi:hypothetical protein
MIFFRIQTFVFRLEVGPVDVNELQSRLLVFGFVALHLAPADTAGRHRTPEPAPGTSG